MGHQASHAEILQPAVSPDAFHNLAQVSILTTITQFGVKLNQDKKVLGTRRPQDFTKFRQVNVAAMAQGQIKKSAAPAKSAPRSSTSGVTKRGLGTKKPKNTKLIKAAKINKKFTGGLTAQTEKMLGQRAGHLEMIGQGRKKGGEEKAVHGKKGGEKRTAKKS